MVQEQESNRILWIWFDMENMVWLPEMIIYSRVQWVIINNDHVTDNICMLDGRCSGMNGSQEWFCQFHLHLIPLHTDGEKNSKLQSHKQMVCSDFDRYIATARAHLADYAMLITLNAFDWGVKIIWGLLHSHSMNCINRAWIFFIDITFYSLGICNEYYDDIFGAHPSLSF